MRFPVYKPSDSRFVLQLCILTKLRGKREADAEIKNKIDPDINHFDITNAGGKSATKIPIDINIIP